MERCTGYDPVTSGWKPEIFPIKLTSHLASSEGIEPPSRPSHGLMLSITPRGYIGDVDGIRTRVSIFHAYMSESHVSSAA